MAGGPSSPCAPARQILLDGHAQSRRARIPRTSAKPAARTKLSAMSKCSASSSSSQGWEWIARNERTKTRRRRTANPSQRCSSPRSIQPRIRIMRIGRLTLPSDVCELPLVARGTRDRRQRTLQKVTTISVVIRLRTWIESACEDRWLGFLVLAVLVVLLAFTALHSHPDDFVASGALFCGAVLFLVSACPTLRAVHRLRATARLRWKIVGSSVSQRGSPTSPPVSRGPVTAFAGGITPLRR